MLGNIADDRFCRGDCSDGEITVVVVVIVVVAALVFFVVVVTTAAAAIMVVLIIAFAFVSFVDDVVVGSWTALSRSP